MSDSLSVSISVKIGDRIRFGLGFYGCGELETFSNAKTLGHVPPVYIVSVSGKVSGKLSGMASVRVSDSLSVSVSVKIGDRVRFGLGLSVVGDEKRFRA